MELTSSTEPGLQIVTVQEPRIDAAVALAFKDRMRDTTEGGPIPSSSTSTMCSSSIRAALARLSPP